VREVHSHAGEDYLKPSLFSIPLKKIAAIAVIFI
jgi:hypothetical protein